MNRIVDCTKEYNSTEIQELTTHSSTHRVKVAFLLTGAAAPLDSGSVLGNAARSIPEPLKKRAALACDLSGDGWPSTTNTGNAPICSSCRDKPKEMVNPTREIDNPNSKKNLPVQKNIGELSSTYSNNPSKVKSWTRSNYRM